MTQVCLSCGADDNRDTAKFCKACGKPLLRAPQQASPQPLFASSAWPDVDIVAAAVPAAPGDPFAAPPVPARGDDWLNAIGSDARPAAAPAVLSTQAAALPSVAPASPAGAVFPPSGRSAPVAPPVAAQPFAAPTRPGAVDVAFPSPSASLGTPWSPPSRGEATESPDKGHTAAALSSLLSGEDAMPLQRPRPFGMPPSADKPAASQAVPSPARAGMPGPPSSDDAGTGRRSRAIGIVAIAVIVLAGWGVWQWATSKTEQPDERYSVPVLPPPTAAQPPAMPGTDAAPPPTPAAATVNADPSAAAMPAPPAPGPATAAAQQPSPAHAPGGAQPSRQAEAGKTAAATTGNKAVAKPTFGTASAAAPAAPVPAEPAAPPAQAAVTVLPSGPASPQEVCKAAGMFGRSSCLSEQCAKPAFTGHAQCRRWRLERQQEDQQRMYGGS